MVDLKQISFFKVGAFIRKCMVAKCKCGQYKHADVHHFKQLACQANRTVVTRISIFMFCTDIQLALLCNWRPVA